MTAQQRPVAQRDAGSFTADVDELTDAVLTASRLLVAVSARSLAAIEETLTLPQFRTLVVLASRGPMKLVALAELLGVNPSTATRMADRLAAASMLVRDVNPEIRREVILRLSPTGRRVVDDVTARRRREITAIVARMPADQRAGIVAALRAFAEAGGEPPAVDQVPLGWE
jgi:DNA-binding MarR family transcriptional regulator